MQSTRKEFLDTFLARMGAKGDVAHRDRAERALNLALDEVWKRHAWRAFLSPTPYTFSTVANVRTYALPDWFGRVATGEQALRNATTGARIRPISQDEVTALDPAQGTDLEAPGTPQRYFLAGSVGVHTQPAAAGEALEVVSTSVADLTVRALVEGIDSTGDWRREQVVLNGTTPVAIGTWKHVQTFGKSAPEGLDPTTEFTTSAGNVTLRIVAGAVELQKLLPDESALELPTLTLYPMPNVVNVIAVPTFRRPRRLRYDADVLPADWDAALDEDMTVQWRVQAGEIAADTNVPRPKLVSLIELENLNAPRSYQLPFTGGY